MTAHSFADRVRRDCGQHPSQAKRRLDDRDFHRETLARIFADAVQWRLSTVGDAVVDQSILLITKHHINATDAIHLQTALMLRGAIQTAGHELAFVCCDKRLLRAARAAGFATLDPETASASDLTALLN